MEPQFMILGQAAGVAAAMAVRQKLPMHRIDIASLQKKLTDQGQIISLEDNPNGFFQQGNTTVVDDDMSRFVKRTGSWHASENPDVARKDITYRFTDSKEYAEALSALSAGVREIQDLGLVGQASGIGNESTCGNYLWQKQQDGGCEPAGNRRRLGVAGNLRL